MSSRTENEKKPNKQKNIYPLDAMRPETALRC